MPRRGLAIERRLERVLGEHARSRQRSDARSGSATVVGARSSMSGVDVAVQLAGSSIIMRGPTGKAAGMKSATLRCVAGATISTKRIWTSGTRSCRAGVAPAGHIPRGMFDIRLVPRCKHAPSRLDRSRGNVARAERNAERDAARRRSRPWPAWLAVACAVPCEITRQPYRLPNVRYRPVAYYAYSHRSRLSRAPTFSTFSTFSTFRPSDAPEVPDVPRSDAPTFPRFPTSRVPTLPTLPTLPMLPMLPMLPSRAPVSRASRARAAAS